MKFNEIDKQQWDELRPYLDTCVLPLTGLRGDEPPWRVTETLERLRDVLDLLELPFKGRIVTYPAVQYTADYERFTETAETICRRIKQGGFAYVVAVTADETIAGKPLPGADLLIGPQHAQPEEGVPTVRELITGLWAASEK